MKLTPTETDVLQIIADAVGKPAHEIAGSKPKKPRSLQLACQQARYVKTWQSVVSDLNHLPEAMRNDLLVTPLKILIAEYRTFLRAVSKVARYYGWQISLAPCLPMIA